MVTNVDHNGELYGLHRFQSLPIKNINNDQSYLLSLTYHNAKSEQNVAIFPYNSKPSYLSKHDDTRAIHHNSHKDRLNLNAIFGTFKLSTSPNLPNCLNILLIFFYIIYKQKER